MLAEEITGNRLTLSHEAVDAGEYVPAPSGRATHFIEVRDGPYAGRLVDIAGADGTSALLLAEDIEELGLLREGDAFRIRPHWTLDSFFFSHPGEIPLTAAAEPSEADEVKIFDPVAQRFETFWYWTDGVSSGWRDSDGAPADDVVVHQARGLVVGRKDPEDVTFLVLGEVRITPLHAEILPGFNILPNPFPVQYTLDASGLREAGLRGAELQREADSIHAPRIGGGFDIYWLTTKEGAEGYVDFDYRPTGEIAFLNAGQGFVLHRRREEGFWWRVSFPETAIP